ncbi:MAG: polysaccharide deacetylase family protein [bacterium]
MGRRLFAFLAAIGGILGTPGPGSAAPPAPPATMQVLQRTSTAALLRWQPGAGATRGFKMRKSTIAGIHPDPTTFPGGKLAAFTWCTDDCYSDNLLYSPTFDSRGLHFTAFIISGQVGTAGHLTWADIETLHGRGHEIGNHTQNHSTLIDDRAIAVRYTGAEACSLIVKGDSLKTWVAGVPDLRLSLATPEVFYLSTLTAYLDALPGYEATLLYAPDTIPATASTFLDQVSGLHIGAGAPAETLTTERGVHDDAEMRAEILNCQNALETDLRAIDPTYVCNTLGYPNHGHTQWAMSTLNQLGYLGARSGGTGLQPFYSQGSYKVGFTTTYEVPISYPRPNNAWTEAQTRTTFQGRIATWKQNHEWTVLMSHNSAETDPQHLEWTIDTIAADPQVWIASFGEVMQYLQDFYQDPGYPAGTDGWAEAWVNGLDPTQAYYVVVTAYNASLQESGWSPEVLVPAFSPGTGVVAPGGASVAAPRAIPNPFSRTTSIVFSARSPGVGRVEFWDVTGRRVRALDLGWVAAGPNRFAWDGRGDGAEPLGAGVYWYRIRSGAEAQTGRVALVR